MRPRKRAAFIEPSFLVELASDAAMGVAVGLAFAFLVTHIDSLGIASLMRHSTNPSATLSLFVMTCAATFGIGATLTGLVITLIDGHDADGSKG